MYSYNIHNRPLIVLFLHLSLKMRKRAIRRKQLSRVTHVLSGGPTVVKSGAALELLL